MVPKKARPLLEPLRNTAVTFTGLVGDRLRANNSQWLIPAPDANPAMLQMFRDRDRHPPRDMPRWSGEFAGKYLISACQAIRLTRDPILLEKIRKFVPELIATQRPDGYLGPNPASENMMGTEPSTGRRKWDLWGQYHVMLGLLHWHQLSGDPAALASARRCADHFCDVFLSGKHRVKDAGAEEMNESSIHIFLLLYQVTGEQRYWTLAKEIEKDWQDAGDYVRTALAGKPFFETPRPRWESLHSVQAIAELYFLTSDPDYKKAYEQIWTSIRDFDRHNTGGFSSAEMAVGNPYDPRAIETCCTVAWMAVTLDWLRISGDPRAADELELSFFNGILGAQSPSGRWWTYNTPMDGVKKASAHEIVFQAGPGSPELNCCSVNGPRGLGMLADWAIMSCEGGFALNWFAPATFVINLPSGELAGIQIQSNYPVEGAVRIILALEIPEDFTLKIRIPAWSTQTAVEVNGQSEPAVTPGSYLTLRRTWKNGDVIDLALDMRLGIWPGEREAAGKMSLYRGPILLAYDPRFTAPDAPELPGIIPEEKKVDSAEGAIIRVHARTDDGRNVTLCDFATAGIAGNAYRSWLPITAAGMTELLRTAKIRR